MELNLYLDLKEEGFNATKQKAKQESVEMMGEEETPSLMFNNLTILEDEFYFEKSENSIHISGELKNGSTDFGYFSVDIPIETIEIEIIEHLLKKLGRMKTALEALK